MARIFSPVENSLATSDVAMSYALRLTEDAAKQPSMCGGVWFSMLDSCCDPSRAGWQTVLHVPGKRFRGMSAMFGVLGPMEPSRRAGEAGSPGGRRAWVSLNQSGYPGMLFGAPAVGS